mmetsp:Transcript_29939/g.95414  ORF Transcript_29939/g.95414 Transcript_29939/m.95414 type:complete len:353 (+) Transcript_29939:847-1905(+)
MGPRRQSCGQWCITLLESRCVYRATWFVLQAPACRAQRSVSPQVAVCSLLLLWAAARVMWRVHASTDRCERAPPDTHTHMPRAPRTTHRFLRDPPCHRAPHTSPSLCLCALALLGANLGGDGTLSPSGPNSGVFGFDEADVRSGKDAAVGEAVNDVRRLVGSPPEADGARGPLSHLSGRMEEERVRQATECADVRDARGLAMETRVWRLRRRVHERDVAVNLDGVQQRKPPEAGREFGVNEAGANAVLESAIVALGHAILPMHVRRGRRGGAQEAVALKDSSHGPVGFEEFASSVAVEAPDGDSARATQIQVHVQGDVRVALGLEEVRPLESRIVVGENDGVTLSSASVMPY